MSDPVDIKTAKIFQNFDTKPDFANQTFLTFNKDEVYGVLAKNSNATIASWFKLQQAWCHNAYNTFKDYDTYVILIYLVNKVFKKYSDRLQYLTIDEFYSNRDTLQIEKLNLIEISKDLNIPKETIRRKVNFLQRENVIFRKGKSIYFNTSIAQHQRPGKSKQMMAVYLEKNGHILAKESWFGRAFSREEIEKFIDNHFTICWQHWFRLQIPFLTNHRTFFGDLETWNVWGSIGLSQFTSYTEQVKNEVIVHPKDNQDLYVNLLKHKPKNGINASSISEISSIPRATVIRKLKHLVKQKLITKNNKLEYNLFMSPKNLKSMQINYNVNQKRSAGFITTMFDLMKNSKFKIQ